MESVAYQSIRGFEAFAHVSGSQADKSWWPPMPNTTTLSKTLSSRSKVPESKSCPHLDPSPLDNTTPKRILLACLRAVCSDQRDRNQSLPSLTQLAQASPFQCRCRTLGFKNGDSTKIAHPRPLFRIRGQPIDFSCSSASVTDFLFFRSHSNRPKKTTP